MNTKQILQSLFLYYNLNEDDKSSVPSPYVWSTTTTHFFIINSSIIQNPQVYRYLSFMSQLPHALNAGPMKSLVLDNGGIPKPL